jgi:Flp pilus assembly protein TadG
MRLMIASIVLALSAGLAHAADATCEAKAVDKNGKALAGAAKAASIKKCEKSSAGSACAAKALDKNGKALAGAAKNSFMKKCEAEAK